MSVRIKNATTFFARATKYFKTKAHILPAALVHRVRKATYNSRLWVIVRVGGSIRLANDIVLTPEYVKQCIHQIVMDRKRRKRESKNERARKRQKAIKKALKRDRSPPRTPRPKPPSRSADPRRRRQSPTVVVDDTPPPTATPRHTRKTMTSGYHTLDQTSDRELSALVETADTTRTSGVPPSIATLPLVVLERLSTSAIAKLSTRSKKKTPKTQQKTATVATLINLINFPRLYAITIIYSCYINDNWTFNGYEVRTDLPSNTYCRAPGSTEGVAMTENIMEHIAKVAKRNPLKVRLANMNDVDKAALESMIKDLSKSADYEMRKRAVETFNNENRWKKKGIALVPIKYPLGYFGQFNAMVSVCARDGTVCVTHGGFECGQGINTKVAQVGLLFRYRPKFSHRQTKQ
ncbi:uncharacterized protein [Temnothorax longispinosus]|uniref:uncharacterized protein n=1 Tax=Temnothorax longispinosus TaxID=300112 RepID=UPI003A99F007